MMSGMNEVCLFIGKALAPRYILSECTLQVIKSQTEFTSQISQSKQFSVSTKVKKGYFK